MTAAGVVTILMDDYGHFAHEEEVSYATGVADALFWVCGDDPAEGLEAFTGADAIATLEETLDGTRPTVKPPGRLPSMEDPDEQDVLRRLALYLDLPLSKVQEAAERKADESLAFKLPRKSNRLTPSQRKIILQLVDEFVFDIREPHKDDL